MLNIAASERGAKTRWRPQLIPPAWVSATFAAVFWSGNFIVGRALRDAVPPVSLNTCRWLLALAILLPLTWRQVRSQLPLLGQHWRLILGLGLTGIAAFHTCVYVALTSTTAVNALLLLAIQPVAIMLGAWLALHERLGMAQAVGVLISLGGAVVLVSHGRLEALLELNFNRGDLWMVAAITIFAAYSIMLRLRPAELRPLVLFTAHVTAGVAFMLPLQVWSLARGESIRVDLGVAAGIAYIGIFASVFAFALWIDGVARLGPSRAGTYIHLMPVFGPVLAFIFLGEQLASFHAAGAALVFSGIALASRR